MQPFKTVTLEEIFTPEEANRARELYAEKSNESFNSRIVRELIEPNIDRINKATNNVNHPRYLGYAIEWCLMQEARGKARKSNHKTHDTYLKRRA